MNESRVFTALVSLFCVLGDASSNEQDYASATYLPAVNAEPVFDDPRLNAFIADMLDRYNSRHYNLVSKQLAIHKWLIRGCMGDLGFDDESSSNADEWSEALYGKYAYCYDHHIPGIDPPCPSEEVIEQSVNGSCFQRSHDQIDWSSDIVRAFEKGMPDDQWRQDPKDKEISAIESEWSACMESHGYQYKTRVDMYSSIGTAMDLSVEEQALLPDETEVLQSAEGCFDKTNYYQKRSELAKSRRDDYLISQKNKVEILVQRYEKAERSADVKIQEICETDKRAIAVMFEKGKYSEQSICADSR